MLLASERRGSRVCSLPAQRHWRWIFTKTDRNETPPGPLPLQTSPGSGFVFQTPVSRGAVEEGNLLFSPFPKASAPSKTGGDLGRLRVPPKAPAPPGIPLSRGNQFNGKVIPTLGLFSRITPCLRPFPPFYPGPGDIPASGAEVANESNLTKGLGNPLKIRDSKHSPPRTLPRSLF